MTLLLLSLSQGVAQWIGATGAVAAWLTILFEVRRRQVGLVRWDGPFRGHRVLLQTHDRSERARDLVLIAEIKLVGYLRVEAKRRGQKNMTNEILIGIGGLILGVLTYFAGVWRTEKRHATQDRDARIRLVFERYMGFRRTNYTGGYDGLQKIRGCYASLE
jgi:hypothetical protein